MAGSVDKKNEKRALTNGLKHDIMKFRGNCVTMSNRREEYGEKKEVLYLHAGLHSCSDMFPSYWYSSCPGLDEMRRRENINVQFMAGKMQKLMNGGWAGGPAPYGYRSVNKKLVVETSDAKIVKLIFAKYIQDDGTLNGVAIWLNGM